MIFLNLPLYNAYGARPTYDPHAGAVIAHPNTFVTVNVAHISCLSIDTGQEHIYTQVYVGNNSWTIGMTRDAILNEIKNAVEQARAAA